MRNKVIGLLVLTFSLSLLLTGCWDRLELNDRAIILGWGMDLADDGTYMATANIVVPLASKTTGSQGEEPGGVTGFLTESAYGKDNLDATQNMQRKLSRILFPGHRRNIFIGEKLAEAGVAQVLDEYSRNPSVRPRTNIFVVKDATAQKAMSLSYQLESNPSTAVQKIQEKIGAPISRSLLDFFMMVNGGSCGVMPALRVAPSESKNKKEKPTDNPPQTTLELIGAAVFDQQLKLAGYLGSEEFWVRLWLTGTLRKRDFTYPVGGPRETVTVSVNHFENKVIPQVKGNTVSFNVQLQGYGVVMENESGLDLSKPESLEQIQREMSRHIQRQVKKIVTKAQKELKCDVFGFGDALHKRHPYHWKQMKSDWPQLFLESDIDIEVKFKLTGTGTTGKSLVPDVADGDHLL
ncbi:Ger(x)C family spore germination protein [Paenibacillus filicis]|uniref:Ger(X)C family spore germination protein n=1 Tax=Paenibacillus filicis TaxID=669464 RepID=A0ABU9DU67_9BACL